MWCCGVEVVWGLLRGGGWAGDRGCYILRGTVWQDLRVGVCAVDNVSVGTARATHHSNTPHPRLSATHPLLCLAAHALLQVPHVVVPLSQLLLQGRNLTVGNTQLTLSILECEMDRAGGFGVFFVVLAKADDGDNS